MPAYNCDKFVAKAIESMLNQTYANFELLIADDCSTDGTKRVIDSFTDQRIKRFHNGTNQGYLKASNLLFAKCQGEFITFQDADDYSDKGRLEKLVNFFQLNAKVSCVGSNISKIDTDNNVFLTSDFPLEHTDIESQFQKSKVVMTGSSLMIRREVLTKIGGYNLYFDRLGSEDVYWYSLIVDDFNVANVSDALYFYRANPNSVASTFKDPRTNVMHNLIVLMHTNKRSGKKDFLKEGQINRANDYCKGLLLIERAKTNKMGALMSFIGLIITKPIIAGFFFRDFFFTLVRSQINRTDSY